MTMTKQECKDYVRTITDNARKDLETNVSSQVILYELLSKLDDLWDHLCEN